MNIIYKNVNDIIPYEKNARINDKAIEKVALSIEEFGFQQPIIIDKENVIICGHTRLAAAKELGMEEVPCIVADNLTQEQVKAYRIIDNKTNEYAEWDTDLLNQELREIYESAEIDIEQFDFVIPDDITDIDLCNLFEDKKPKVEEHEEYEEDEEEPQHNERKEEIKYCPHCGMRL